MTKNVLSEKISEPLNGATTARIDIQAGDGNLTIDRLSSSQQVLASGMLEYTEKQGLPSRSLEMRNNEACQGAAITGQVQQNRIGICISYQVRQFQKTH